MTRKFRVEKIVVNKNGKGKASIVDLALLKVTEEIPLPMYTPLCLPDAGYDIRGQNVTLTGTRHDTPQYNKDVCRVGPTELSLSQHQPRV